MKRFTFQIIDSETAILRCTLERWRWYTFNVPTWYTFRTDSDKLPKTSNRQFEFRWDCYLLSAQNACSAAPFGVASAATGGGFELVQNWFEPIQNWFDPVQRLQVLEIRSFSAVLERKWPLDRAWRSNLYRSLQWAFSSESYAWISITSLSYHQLPSSNSLNQLERSLNQRKSTSLKTWLWGIFSNILMIKFDLQIEIQPILIKTFILFSWNSAYQAWQSSSCHSTHFLCLSSTE
jgi:hypothetical protein